MGLRILHVIGSLDPAAGGPPSVLWRLASAQAALGHRVATIGPRDPAREPVIQESRRTVVGIERLRIEPTDAPASRLAFLTDTRVPRAMDRIAEEFGGADVVHLHGVWDVPIVRAAAWARRRGVPYIVRPAGMLDIWSLRRSKWKKRIAMALAHRRMLRGAAAIHALNAHECDTIAMLRLGPPIEVIPNGVFLEEIDIPADVPAFRESLRGLDNRPYVLFLSRLHYKKGLDILAEAWKIVSPKFPDHRLVVAGPKEDDAVEDFRRRIAQGRAESSVIEAGAVYASRKAAAFRGCACFVLPSRQEGFSVAITEALALGAPVVVSTDCHFPEVTEAGAGIETSLEPASVADGIRRMLADDAFRAACGAAGARLVRERFIWPRIAAQTIALYERIRRA